MDILPVTHDGSFDAQEFVESLESEGWAFLSVAGGATTDPHLQVTTPTGAMAPEHRATIRRHKPAILALLRERERSEAINADQLLSEQGWVVVHCRALDGARVLWTLEGGPPEGLPPELRGLPRYTLGELSRLVEHPEVIGAAHTVKVFFPDAEVLTVNNTGGKGT